MRGQRPPGPAPRAGGASAGRAAPGGGRQPAIGPGTMGRGVMGLEGAAPEEKCVEGTGHGAVWRGSARPPFVAVRASPPPPAPRRDLWRSPRNRQFPHGPGLPLPGSRGACGGRETPRNTTKTPQNTSKTPQSHPQNTSKHLKSTPKHPKRRPNHLRTTPKHVKSTPRSTHPGPIRCARCPFPRLVPPAPRARAPPGPGGRRARCRPPLLPHGGARRGEAEPLTSVPCRLPPHARLPLGFKMPGPPRK